MTRARDDLARLLDGDDSGSGPEGSGRALEALGLARRELEAATAVRPEFREALRTRLLAVAAVQPGTASARATGGVLRGVRTRGRLAALSGALAGIVAVTGVGVAASRSGPGDIFYGAKRTVEMVKLGVASGNRAEQGLNRLKLATTRLSELEALSASGRTVGLPAPPSAAGRTLAAGPSRAQVWAVLDDMDDDVRDGFALMLDAYRDTGDRGPLVVVRGWSVQQGARLRALLPRLSAALQPRGEGSLSLVREVEASVVVLLAAPSPSDPVPAPEVPGRPAPGGPPGSAPAPAGPSVGVPDDDPTGPAPPGTAPSPTAPVPLPLPQPTVGGDDVPQPGLPSAPPGSKLPPGASTAPTGGLPTTDVPTTDVPTTDEPTTDVPTTDVPTTDGPTTDVPTTDVPTGAVPTGDVPDGDLPPPGPLSSLPGPVDDPAAELPTVP